VVVLGHHRVGMGAVKERAGAADGKTLLASLLDVAPGQHHEAQHHEAKRSEHPHRTEPPCTIAFYCPIGRGTASVAAKRPTPAVDDRPASRVVAGESGERAA